jgi:membrane protein DedA with SNARE-associated domain
VDAVLDWVISVMRTVGAPGVGVATAVETVFPPVPSEVVLPLAGVTASRGHYGVLAAVLWATAGSLVGALVLYRAGAVWGRDRLCRLADRMPLLGSHDVERSIAWFARHGRSAVLVGRLVPGVRSLISIPAGIERMPLAQFVAYTTVGSLAWNAALVVAGYQLGSQWHLVADYVDQASSVVYVLLAAAVGTFVVRRLRRRSREADAAKG